MNTICLSASLRFEDEIKSILKQSKVMGLTALFPNFPPTVKKDEITIEKMKQLIQDHFKAIEKADALYVINPGGYIGNLVKIEIGYALGKNKPVYYSHKTEETDLDSLSTGIVPLNSVQQFLYL